MPEVECCGDVGDANAATVGTKKTAKDCLTPAPATMRVTQKDLMIALTVVKMTANAVMNVLTVAKMTTPL